MVASEGINAVFYPTKIFQREVVNFEMPIRKSFTANHDLVEIAIHNGREHTISFASNGRKFIHLVSLVLRK